MTLAGAVLDSGNALMNEDNSLCRTECLTQLVMCIRNDSEHSPAQDCSEDFMMCESGCRGNGEIADMPSSSEQSGNDLMPGLNTEVSQEDIAEEGNDDMAEDDIAKDEDDIPEDEEDNSEDDDITEENQDRESP